MSWIPVLLACLGCYLLKLAGLLLPERVLEHPVVRTMAAALPVGVLAALVAVQTFSTDTEVVIDARAAGVAVAIVALLLRAPFIVVVGLAALTAAVVRLVT
ncbi:MAG TPA: AzlD domain-containing protein [Actinopolymorphaceae bacterium]